MTDSVSPPQDVIREWANDLREDAKAADVFAGMAADAGEKRAAAWLRGCSEGLRLAAIQAALDAASHRRWWRGARAKKGTYLITGPFHFSGRSGLFGSLRWSRHPKPS